MKVDADTEKRGRSRNVQRQLETAVDSAMQQPPVLPMTKRSWVQEAAATQPKGASDSAARPMLQSRRRWDWGSLMMMRRTAELGETQASRVQAVRRIDRPEPELPLESAPSRARARCYLRA